MRYIIAVDIGTTHCKAITVDERANTVHSFKETINSLQPQEDFHEQNAEEIFEAVMRLLHRSFQSINQNEIACVSFSAAMHSFFAVDDKGAPMMHAITWADTRSKKYAQQLRNSEEGKNIYTQTGTAIHAMSPLCKLIWLRHERPVLFSSAHKFISVKEYIFSRLFGKFIIDAGIASATGLYDIYNNCWFKKALDIAAINESKLSTIVAATHIETEMIREMQERLELNHHIPFVCGGNDGCLANLGSGALHTNEAALTIGTSGAVRVTIPKPSIHEEKGLFTYALTNDLYVTGGPTNNGGIALQWFAENFLQKKITEKNQLQEVLELAAKAPVGSDGVYFLPYLFGERAPVWDEDASGMFFGLRMYHKKESLTRAVVEGISFSLWQILNNIEATGISVEKIYVSGVVTTSEWWMQLLADVLGKKIVLTDGTDASAKGAAFIGMLATGIMEDISSVLSLVNPIKIFDADEDNHRIYKQHLKTFTALYPAFKNIPA